MKKNLFILAAAAMLAAVSCQEEIAAPEIDSTNEGAFTITASVGVETKTVLGENGKSSYWAKGDKISVFDSKKEANNRCFKIVEEGVDFSKDQKTATFGSDEEFTWPQNNQEDPLIVSLYPYQPAAYCDFFYYDRNYITGLNIPVEQTAVAGGFDSSATFALATGKYSTKDDLKFTNLYSLLKVSVVEENVKTITVTVGENEYIAGEAKVQLNLVVENEVAEFKGGALTASGSNSVTLKCEEGFEVGETYYIAVAPVTYTSISVALNGKVVKSATVTKTLQANTIYSVLGIDDPATVADGVYLNESGVYEISNEAGLFWLAEQVADGETFDGKTVKLTEDITMTKVWTPIGNLDNGVNFSFRGTFDGNDKTISNLEVESAECAGFFGAKWDGDVKNVKFDNATVSGNHYAGVVAAWTDGANYNYKFTISGCEITNSTVTLEAEQTAEGWDNGDKAGAVVGYAYAIVVTDNTVSNTTITGYRDLGGVVGCAISNKFGSYAEVKNNNVGENVKVIVDNTHNYKNFTSSSKYNVASHCGRIDNVDGVNNIVSDNTGEATLVTPKERNLNYSNDKAEVVLGDADPDLPVLNGEKDGVEYSSENTDVATVDADGKVTIKKAGTTTITATAPETETYLAGTASYTLTVKDVVYLVPNDNWKTANARFAAVFMTEDKSTQTWIDMTSDGDIYSCQVPDDDDYLYVIFCRMNPNNKDNKWDNKWDQTGDMSLKVNKYCVIPPLEWSGTMVWSDDKSVPFIEDGYYYLYPSNNWKESNARFAVYLCNGTSNAKWISMTAVGEGTNYYKVKIPAGENHKNIIFCRMNPSSSTNDWSNKWNQTGDLDLNSGNVYQTIDWDNGSWHTIK